MQQSLIKPSMMLCAKCKSIDFGQLAANELSLPEYNHHSYRDLLTSAGTCNLCRLIRDGIRRSFGDSYLTELDYQEIDEEILERASSRPHWNQMAPDTIQIVDDRKSEMLALPNYLTTEKKNSLRYLHVIVGLTNITHCNLNWFSSQGM